MGLLIPNPQSHHPNDKTSIYTWHILYIDQAIRRKHDNDNPLTKAIKAQEWKVRPLEVITAWVRDTIHTRSTNLLESLQTPPPKQKIEKK